MDQDSAQASSIMTFAKMFWWCEWEREHGGVGRLQKKWYLCWGGWGTALGYSWSLLGLRDIATNPAFLAEFRGVIVEIQRKTKGTFENISGMSYT